MNYGVDPSRSNIILVDTYLFRRRIINNWPPVDIMAVSLPKMGYWILTPTIIIKFHLMHALSFLDSPRGFFAFLVFPCRVMQWSAQENGFGVIAGFLVSLDALIFKYGEGWPYCPSSFVDVGLGLAALNITRVLACRVACGWGLKKVLFLFL